MASSDLDLWTMNLDGSGKKRITTTWKAMTAARSFHMTGRNWWWRANHPDSPEKMKSYRRFTERKSDYADENGSFSFPTQMDRMPRRRSPTMGAPASPRPSRRMTRKFCFLLTNTTAIAAISICTCVNLDGSGLERVTDYGMFTSFPEFSPDGKKLVFASEL